MRKWKISKMIKSLEDSGLLMKGVKTIENETKE